MSYPALLYFSTAMALLGSVQFGFHVAVLNTSLDFVCDSLDIPAARGAVAVSAVLVGALIGSLGAGQLADRLGPKTATVLNALPLAFGSCLCAAAPSETMLLTGRALAGLGTGAASLLVPRYLSEIAPTPIRGLLGTLNQICINVGIVAAFALGWPYDAGQPRFVDLLGWTDVPWWRVQLAAGAVPAAAQATGMAACPESPVWLLWSGLHAQASASYRALHGAGAGGEADGDGEGEGAAPLLGGAGDAAEAGGGGEVPRSEGFAALLDPRYRRVMMLAAGLPLLQQAGGINTVVLYGTAVFRAAGVTSPVAANVAMGVVNTAATVAAAGLMDRAGRKPLLTWSFAGMGVALGALAAASLLHPSISPRAALACILLYIVAFALGCGPVPWVYLPEVLPPAIKGPAQAACTALNWGGNLAVGATFPAMLRGMGLGGAYAVYAALCVGSAAFCGRYMVETKRRRLEAVHAELMGGGMRGPAAHGGAGIP